MRWSFRKVACFTLACFTLAVFMVATFYIVWSIYGLEKYLPIGFRIFQETFTESSFLKGDLKVRSEIHHSKKVDTLFNEFAQDNRNLRDSRGVSKWKSQPLLDRCEDFFTHWLAANPDWKFQKFGDNFDKSIVNKKRFFEVKYDRIKQRYKQNNIEGPLVTRENNNTIQEEYLLAIKATMDIETKMVETMSLFRVYGKCFLNQNQETVSHPEIFKKMTDKLFPFLSGQLPIFERFDGKVYNEGFPEMLKYEKSQDILLNYIQRNVQGKGILVSATTKHARDLIKLIRVLRAHNNELPIQIVHKGDISQRNQQYLLAAAQTEVDDMLDPKLSTDYMNVSPELDLKEDSKRRNVYFPKQDLTFVNIKQCISREYKYNFPGYANKLLALFFTSFKEVLLFDADTIPLVPPKEFFDLEGYKAKSAFFFKDRTLNDFNDYIETNFFTKLCPTLKSNSLDDLFDIPVITEHTLNNGYMTGWRHFQEAGVVAVDKSKHFLGVALASPLSIWKDPVVSSVWGDKELYWLALSIAGDENYAFNEHYAASVGVATTNPKYKQYTKSNAHEVCSSHPGHISNDGRLLWINSGFSYCKKNGIFRDRNLFPYSAMDTSEQKGLFDQPLRIQHALVPPGIPRIREPGSPIDDTPETELLLKWKSRPKDVDEINKDVKSEEEKISQLDSNPQKGWVKSQACAGYYYCAYDLIDSYFTDKDVDNGEFFEYDDNTVSTIEFLAKVWMTGTTKTKLPVKAAEPETTQGKENEGTKKEGGLIEGDKQKKDHN